jgi:hypothetical protein
MGGPTSFRPVHQTDRDREIPISTGPGAKACRDGYTVSYRPVPQLFRDLKLFRDLMIERADGSLGQVWETLVWGFLTGIGIVWL